MSKLRTFNYFVFNFKSLRFLFQKRNSCKEGKARVRLHRSIYSSYKGSWNIQKHYIQFIYKWRCNCNNGWNKPYCKGMEGDIVCIPQWKREEGDKS